VELEAYEITEHSFLPNHHGFERVDVGTADLGGLLDLDRIPFIHEIHFAGPRAAALGHRADWVNAAVDSHVAGLPCVLRSAERDDRPVLEFEWRIFLQFCFRLRKIGIDLSPTACRVMAQRLKKDGAGPDSSGSKAGPAAFSGAGGYFHKTESAQSSRWRRHRLGRPETEESMIPMRPGRKALPESM
jgi:hypothetical protein